MKWESEIKRMKTQVNWFERILLTGLLCLLFAVMVPVRVLAETYTGSCGGAGNENNVTWSYDDGTKILTISGSGKMADYEYPSYRPWNNYINTATTITVDDQITNIGKWSFDRDSSAGECTVSIPSSVTEIGEYAFMSCRFSSMSIHWSGIKTIGRYAFEGATFPAGPALTFDDSSSLTSIGDRAFNSCNLSSLTISKSNVDIGEMAFHDCESLATISITGDHTNIGESAFSFDSKNSSVTTITIGGQGTTIGYGAFMVSIGKEAHVNSLNLLEGITTIGQDAFEFSNPTKCLITSLTLPTTLTDIGSRAFNHMGKLETLYIPGEGRQLTNNILGAVNRYATIIHAASTNVSGISSRDVDRVEYTVDGSSVSVTAIDGNDGTTGSVTVPPTIPRSANSADGSYPVAAVLHREGITVHNKPAEAADITYQEETDGTITITNITKGTSSDVTIPATIQGKTVAKVENAPEGVTLNHTHHYANGLCTICGDSQPQTPQPQPSQEGSSTGDASHDDSGTDTAADHSTERTGSDALVLSTTTGQSNMKAIKTKQGVLCQLTFRQAMPAGYTEAFSFNLLQDGKTTYDKRQNVLTISIPGEYQKSGRSYKVIGINKQGKPLTFEDTDINAGTITININGFDGYAFDLIYTDTAGQLPSGKGSTANSPSTTANLGSDSQGSYYVVQKGDVLSRIAITLGKKRQHLIDKNKMSDPDQLKVGEKIYF